jgi:hypothetical protein
MLQTGKLSTVPGPRPFFPNSDSVTGPGSPPAIEEKRAIEAKFEGSDADSIPAILSRNARDQTQSDDGGRREIHAFGANEPDAGAVFKFLFQEELRRKSTKSPGAIEPKREDGPTTLCRPSGGARTGVAG